VALQIVKRAVKKQKKKEKERRDQAPTKGADTEQDGADSDVRG